jgi:hypothetical protein
MKTFLVMVIGLASCLSYCSAAKDDTPNLSTPENTLVSYYEGFRKSDFEYQRKTIESSIGSAARKRFDLLKPVFGSYQILRTRGAKEREHDEFRLPEGDVDAMVKEIYKDKNENMVSFVLRKFNSDWLIIDILTLEKSDIIQGNKVIKK